MKRNINLMKHWLGVVLCVAVLLTSIPFTVVAVTELTAETSENETMMILDDANYTFTAISGTVSVTEENGIAHFVLPANSSVKIAYNGVWNVERTFVNPHDTDDAEFDFTGTDGIDLTITLQKGTVVANDSCWVTVGNRKYSIGGAATISINTQDGAKTGDAIITTYSYVEFDTHILLVGTEDAPATLTLQGDRLLYCGEDAPISEYNTITDWQPVEGKENTWEADLITRYLLWIENKEVTSQYLQDQADDQWTWRLIPSDDPETPHTLVLRNADLKGELLESGQYDGDKSAAISYYGDRALTIELIGKNTLEAGENRDSWSAAIETSEVNLTVIDYAADDEVGSLTAKGNLASGSGSSSHNSAGIYVSNGDLYIKSGDITVIGDHGDRGSFGIYVSGSLTINGDATVFATANNATGMALGIQCEQGGITIGGNAVVKAVGETDGEQAIGMESHYFLSIEDDATITAEGKWQALSGNISLRFGDYNTRAVIDGKEQVIHRKDLDDDEEIWYAATYFQMPFEQFTVHVSAEPPAGGTVTGGGIYDRDTAATLVATPNANYRFVRWEENGQTISDRSSYTFTVDRDYEIVAVFEEISSTNEPDPDSNETTDPEPNDTPVTAAQPQQDLPQNDAGVPETGDHRELILWLLLALISGVLVASMYIWDKTKQIQK